MFVTDKANVGDLKHSLLTEAQFQAVNGTCWILADGRSITGSLLQTVYGFSNAPDARDTSLRGKQNGRSDGFQDAQGEKALGAHQVGSVQNHNHSWWDYTGVNGRSYSGDGTVFNYPAGINAGVSRQPSPEGNATGILNTIYTSGVTQQTAIQNVTGVTNLPGSDISETRISSTICNIFVKIN